MHPRFSDTSPYISGPLAIIGKHMHGVATGRGTRGGCAMQVQKPNREQIQEWFPAHPHLNNQPVSKTRAALRLALQLDPRPPQTTCIW